MVTIFSKDGKEYIFNKSIFALEPMPLREGSLRTKWIGYRSVMGPRKYYTFNSDKLNAFCVVPNFRFYPGPLTFTCLRML